VQADAVASWIAVAEHDDRSALRLARAAAEREDRIDKHPVTPGEVLPARELYADLLLELGRARPAYRQYQRVLAHAPNRTNALLGAAEAAAAAGDPAAAARLYRQALEQTASGHHHRPRLAAARAYLAQAPLR
jgi:hypothetical protein